MRKKYYICISLYIFSTWLIFKYPLHAKTNNLWDCGPGVYHAKKSEFISTTNGTFLLYWPLYSSATLAGTSECKGFALNDKQRVKYIANNFYEIQIDVAKGEGTFLDGLTTIMGCDGTNFRKILKDDYSNIFNKDNSNGKQIYNALRHKIKNSELKNLCLDSS